MKQEGQIDDVVDKVGQHIALEAMGRTLDAVYRERNQVVAALTKCFPAWIGSVDDAEPGWMYAVYIDLPTGQVSWHISDAEVTELFGHLKYGGAPWDGHSTDEKYARLAALDSEPLSGYVTMMSNIGETRYIINGEEVSRAEYEHRRRMQLGDLAQHAATIREALLSEAAVVAALEGERRWGMGGQCMSRMHPTVRAEEMLTAALDAAGVTEAHDDDAG